MIGADAIIKCLEEEGVKYVFGYPGVAICPFYNSIHMKAAQEVLEGQRSVTYKGRKLSMKKYHFFSGRLSKPKLRIGGHQFK